MYAIYMFIVKFVERCRKANKVVNEFHFQLHFLEGRPYLLHCACMLLLFAVVLTDGFIGEFIICLPQFFGEMSMRQGNDNLLYQYQFG